MSTLLVQELIMFGLTCKRWNHLWDPLRWRLCWLDFRLCSDRNFVGLVLIWKEGGSSVDSAQWTISYCNVVWFLRPSLTCKCHMNIPRASFEKLRIFTHTFGHVTFKLTMSVIPILWKFVNHLSKPTIGLKYVYSVMTVTLSAGVPALIERWYMCSNASTKLHSDYCS